jgi:hypothetical protein
LLLLPSLFQHHYRRRQWRVAIVFFFSNTKKTKHIKKQQKKNLEKGGSLFSSFRIALSLLAPASNLMFQTCSPSIFFSSKRKEMQRRERTFLQAFALSSHFWFSLLPFCFKRFLLASSSSQT